MEEICYFSTVRRISNFTGWNRIFGGWGTDKKTQNIQIHSSSIAFFEMRDLAQVGDAAENLYSGGAATAGLCCRTRVGSGSRVFRRESK